MDVSQMNSPPLGTAPIDLSTILDPSRIIFITETKKDAVLHKLADILSKDSRIHDGTELITAIQRREELMSTGIGLGVGVPHVRIDSVDDIVMAVGICAEPVSDYESLDDEPVRIICMIAANSSQHAKHIKLLSAVSKLLKDSGTRQKIISASSAQEVFSIFVGGSHA
jgi:PTS system nitrogen regulatory IIA component